MIIDDSMGCGDCRDFDADTMDCGAGEPLARLYTAWFRRLQGLQAISAQAH